MAELERKAGVNATRAVAVGALLAVLIGGCATGPSPRYGIGSDGAAHLRRAADNIEQASADLDRSVEARRDAVTLAAEAWPELHEEWRALDASADKRSRDDALLRKVAGILREIADGSPVPPQEWFIQVAGIFRDIAARVRGGVIQLTSQLERLRDAEGVGAVGDRVVRELVESADAMKDAAVHYEAAADGAARATAYAPRRGVHRPIRLPGEPAGATGPAAAAGMMPSQDEIQR